MTCDKLKCADCQFHLAESQRDLETTQAELARVRQELATEFSRRTKAEELLVPVVVAAAQFRFGPAALEQTSLDYTRFMQVTAAALAGAIAQPGLRQRVADALGPVSAERLEQWAVGRTREDGT